VDNLSNAHQETFEVLRKLCPTKMKWYEVDLRNYEELDKIIEKHAEEI
jgi:UDP-glucose 4-epimerase